MDQPPVYTPAFCEPQYNQRLNARDRPASMARRAELADRARRLLHWVQDVPYGVSALERLDIYPAEVANAPVMIFVHGGYWQRFDKADVAFLAEAFVRSGVTLVTLNYNLCPSVSLDRIVEEVQAGCAWVWQHIGEYGGNRDRLFVSGNSAGGHLTAMMMATDWPGRDPALPRDLLKGGLAISGIYDLEPLLYTSINRAVGLDLEVARRNSPVLLQPASAAPLIIALGALESDEFHRQAGLLAQTWSTVSVPPMAIEGCDHYSIPLELADPGTPLMRTALSLMNVPAP